MNELRACGDFTVTLNGSELIWLLQAARKEHDDSVSEKFGENYVSLKWTKIADKLEEAYKSAF